MTNKQAINILLSLPLQAPSDGELVDIQAAVKMAIKALDEGTPGQCIKCGRETSGVVSFFDDNGNLTQKVYLCSECWENNDEPVEPVKFTDDITADLSRLKAENNRLTAELERVYELYNGLIASKQEQPPKVCPFGDQRETCAEFRANGCDLCKFATS